jgi:hypothetical protein
MRRSSSIRCLSAVIGGTSTDHEIKNRGAKEVAQAGASGATADLT